jgi:hypothetical protein
LANHLTRKKELEAKLAATSKAMKDSQTRLAADEAKCKKDVAAAKAKDVKAEKALAKANQKQLKHERSIGHMDALSGIWMHCQLPLAVSVTFLIGCIVDFLWQ